MARWNGRQILMLLVLAVALLPVPAFAQDDGSVGTQTYVVRTGDTLAKIGRLYGISWVTLAQVNNISDPNRIELGQVLVIPASDAQVPVAVVSTPIPPPVEQTPALAAPAADTPPPLDTGQVTHIVQRGETLGEIGKLYGVTWFVIAQANGLVNADRIEVGQVLIIPGPSTSPEGNADTATSASPPASVEPGNERWILVELSKQQVTAFENGQPVRQVIVSTGLPGTPTVMGDYHIYLKLASQTMYGPGYYLPDVPWVMYFYRGYGLHGTYWHDNFGQPMSHGCVNLPTDEAEWFYSFAGIGTLVRVVA